jgi:hypothetical protein
MNNNNPSQEQGEVTAEEALELIKTGYEALPDCKLKEYLDQWFTVPLKLSERESLPNCEHLPLIDTGIGYHYCEACKQGFKAEEDLCTEPSDLPSSSVASHTSGAGSSVVPSENIMKTALEKYSSPYGKANPETYAFAKGIEFATGIDSNIDWKQRFMELQTETLNNISKLNSDTAVQDEGDGVEESVSEHALEGDTDKQLEERTDINMKVISDFIDHAKEAGIKIPEKVFLSFFNA